MLAAPEAAPAESVQELSAELAVVRKAAKALSAELDLMRHRFKRRNSVLDEIRRAYLRDVTAVRNVLKQQGVEAGTTLDLRPLLTLYAPAECAFQLAHGTPEQDQYGGHIEVVHRESKRVAALSAKVTELLRLEQSARLTAVKAEAQSTKDRAALTSAAEQLHGERALLGAEVTALRARLDRVDEKALENARRQLATLRRQLDERDTQLAALGAVADDARRARREAQQVELQLAGKERNIAELEKMGEAATRAALVEVVRYNHLEATLESERGGASSVKQALVLETAQLRNTEVKLGASEALVESKIRAVKVAEQRFGDLQTEYADAVAREEAEQEDLRAQFEEQRGLAKRSANDAAALRVAAEKAEVAHGDAMAAAKVQTEAACLLASGAATARAQGALDGAVARLEYAESQLHAETAKRLKFEAASVVAAEALDGGARQLQQLLKLLAVESTVVAAGKIGESYPEAAEGLDLARAGAADLLARCDALRDEKAAAVLHLDQYKAKNGNEASTARLRPAAGGATAQQLFEVVEENDAALAALRAELIAASTARDAAAAENGALTEELKTAKRDVELLRGVSGADAVARHDSAARDYAELEALRSRVGAEELEIEALRRRVAELADDASRAATADAARAKLSVAADAASAAAADLARGHAADAAQRAVLEAAQAASRDRLIDFAASTLASLWRVKALKSHRPKPRRNKWQPGKDPGGTAEARASRPTRENNVRPPVGKLSAPAVEAPTANGTLPRVAEAPVAAPSGAPADGAPPRASIEAPLTAPAADAAPRAAEPQVTVDVTPGAAADDAAPQAPEPHVAVEALPTAPADGTPPRAAVEAPPGAPVDDAAPQAAEPHVTAPPGGGADDAAPKAAAPQVTAPQVAPPQAAGPQVAAPKAAALKPAAPHSAKAAAPPAAAEAPAAAGAVGVAGGNLEEDVAALSTARPFLSATSAVPARGDVERFSRSESGGAALKLINKRLEKDVRSVEVEVSEIRAVLKTLPPGFNYADMMTRQAAIEAEHKIALAAVESRAVAAREALVAPLAAEVSPAPPSPAGVARNPGDSDEMNRLKQKVASQQRFISELQEEAAALSGVLLAADELKKRYGVLETRHAALEDDLADQVALEASARKAKERTDVQLALAQDDAASRLKDNEALSSALRNAEERIAALEQRLAREVALREAAERDEARRLATNVPVSTQFAPGSRDAQVQTAFKTPGMTLRSVNSFAQVPAKRCVDCSPDKANHTPRRLGPGAVTPAIFDAVAAAAMDPASQRPAAPGSRGALHGDVRRYRELLSLPDVPHSARHS